MKNVWSFIKLTRPLNLAIMVFTMLAIRYWLLAPFLSLSQLELLTGSGMFMILVLSVVFIAAGGNVINDYFDVKGDTINKPNKVIVIHELDRRIAIYGHQTLTLLGLALALFYGWKTDMLTFCAIHVFAIISLWYYSSYFKKLLLVGNFLIAALVALVPLIIGVFELLPIIRVNAEDVNNYYKGTGYNAAQYFKGLFFWVLGFAVFAFAATLVREIIKDLEDTKGDVSLDRNTLPLVIGEKPTKVVVTVLIGVFVTTFYLVEEWFLNDSFTFNYFSVFLTLPCLATVVILWKKNLEKRFWWSSNLMKMVLLFGLVYTYFIEKLFVA